MSLYLGVRVCVRACEAEWPACARNANEPPTPRGATATRAAPGPRRNVPVALKERELRPRPALEEAASRGLPDRPPETAESCLLRGGYRGISLTLVMV